MSRDADFEIRAEQLIAHTTFVRSIARAILARDDLADDAVQDTFVAAMARQPREVGRLRSWLGGIVRNKAREIRRREARRHVKEGSVAPAAYSRVGSDALAQRAEVGRQLVARVLKLPEPYRHVLLLRFHIGMSIRSVADTLNVPIETVRTRQRRALEKLRALLDAESKGKGEWMTALLPLTTTWPGSTVVSLGTTGGTTVATIGGTLMAKKIAIGVTAVLLLGGGGYFALRAKDDGPPIMEVARDSDLEATKNTSKDAPSLTPSRQETTSTSPLTKERVTATSHFTGTLLDEVGKPVPDTWIEVKKKSWHKFDVLTFSRVVPNDAGTFAFDIPMQPSQIIIRIHSKTHVPKWGGRTHRIWPDKSVHIVLTPAIQLRVLVLDEDSGAPVSGATVSSYGPLTRTPDAIRGTQPDDEVQTSAEGLAILRSKAGQGAILVRADGYRASMRADVEVREEPDDITIEIGQGGTVRGQVIDESGKGQAGVSINAIGYPPYVSHVVSDEQGHFVLHDTPIATDPKEPLGDYNLMLWIQAPGGSYGRYMRINPPAAAGDAVDVTITWLDARPLRGRVLLPSGRPGSGLSVTVVPEQERLMNWAAKPTTTDRNGCFRFEKCMPGKLRVQVRRDGEVSEVIAEKLAELSTTGKGPFVEVQLTEKPPGESPRLTIRLFAHDGKKLGDGTVSWSVTRPQGRTSNIRASVINGIMMTKDGVRPRLLMWSDAPDYAPQVYRLTEADVDKGKVDVRFPSGTATGRVTRLDGSPVQLAFHASVRHSNPSSRYARWHQGASQILADKQGRFAVHGLGRAKYIIRPTNLNWRILGGHVDIRAGQRDVSVVVGTEAELHDYFVEAIVVDADTSAPVVDWSLMPILVPTGAAADSDAIATLQAVLGSKNLHRSRDPVAPGVYDVVIPAMSGRCEARATGVRVGEGFRRPRVSLTWSRGLSITGRVVDHEGKPARGVQIKAGVHTASVKSDGTYRVTGLEAGLVDVRVTGPYVNEASDSVEVRRAVGATADFRVATGGAIRIQPASSVGPIRQFIATARPDDGGSPVSLSLTADEYELKQSKHEQIYLGRLTPGLWHVDVDWDGKRPASETVVVLNRETTTVKLAPR